MVIISRLWPQALEGHELRGSEVRQLCESEEHHDHPGWFGVGAAGAAGHSVYSQGSKGFF